LREASHDDVTLSRLVLRLEESDQHTAAVHRPDRRRVGALRPPPRQG
jgi:hypothetical protein